MLLDVVEWRILSYLAVMNVWRGVTAEMVGGALALRENDLNETLQRLKEQKLVEAVSSEGTEQLFVTEEGKKAPEFLYCRNCTNRSEIESGCLVVKFH